jgi:hypothetical protein
MGQRGIKPVKNRKLSFLAALVAMAFASAAQAQDLEAQFAKFISWWPGTYDNRTQAEAAPSSFTSVRLHLQAVDLPAFGRVVVYGEWQDIDAGLRVIRQRFYGFEIDHERQTLRLKLHIFPPGPDFVEQTKGAHNDPSKVANLTPADMVPLPGCDVYFTWQGDHFAGAMEKGACAFQAPGTTDDIYSWSQMRLTATAFEYLDGWFNPDGSVYRVLADDWYVFERRLSATWRVEREIPANAILVPEK